MNYIIFASFTVFALFVRGWIKRSNKLNTQNRKAYLENESLANNTRRQSLDDLDYINIPTDFLDSSIDIENLQPYLKELENLSQVKIVNLTGISNTELKLQYGVANLPLLTQYDEAYIKLSRVLNKIGLIYFDNNNFNLAKTYLEFDLVNKSDIRSTYETLANIYFQENDNTKLKKLIDKASSLKSINRNIICRNLQKYNPSVD